MTILLTIAGIWVVLYGLRIHHRAEYLEDDLDKKVRTQMFAYALVFIPIAILLFF